MTRGDRAYSPSSPSSSTWSAQLGFELRQVCGGKALSQRDPTSATSAHPDPQYPLGHPQIASRAPLPSPQLTQSLQWASQSLLHAAGAQPETGSEGDRDFRFRGLHQPRPAHAAPPAAGDAGRVSDWAWYPRDAPQGLPQYVKKIIFHPRQEKKKLKKCITTKPALQKKNMLKGLL